MASSSSVDTELQAMSISKREIGEVTTVETHRAVQHVLSVIPGLLDVALQCTRIQRLQQLEATQKLPRDGHDCAPVVELSAILHHVSMLR